MHAIQACLQTNQIQRHFVVKAVCPANYSFSRKHIILISLRQNTWIKPHQCLSTNCNTTSLLLQLMGCFIQPSNHIENFEKCLDEDNWVGNHGLMKQIHQMAVKCIFNLFLHSSEILPIYYLWQFSLTSP